MIAHIDLPLGLSDKGLINFYTNINLNKNIMVLARIKVSTVNDLLRVYKGDIFGNFRAL